ncbi:MAG: hypothetical protein MAG471_00067 [Acidimicrobiaceae bacterium]|nr:hypothetical protein [Acidimicrobiaceae bacterium]
MGKPVALDASAEERLTRGFISMTTWSPVVGFTANWTFDPPVSTPTRRRHAKAASRISWYSTSVRVCAGATVIESPVWTPIGSRFSMEHTTTQLSARSRMTSSSYSFHPAIDASMRISLIGLAARPSDATLWNSSAVEAMPVPRPPRMYAGRMTTGRPTSATIRSASSMSWAVPEAGTPRPIPIMASLNLARSSAVAIASASAPISSTPYSSSTPASTSSMARFRAVWPPRVGSSASGRSRSIMRVRTSRRRGST